MSAECPNVAARRKERKCKGCGKLHDFVNCSVINSWRKKVPGTRMSLALLLAVIVPENSCIAIPVDLAMEDARQVAGHMYHKHHKYYGALVETK